MRYGCFSKELREKIQKPFVFISYSHKNREVYDRVQNLAKYLKSKNINIVYDKGGLPPGTELTQFENLILDENCKYVLVVCDKGYLWKVQNCEGGAWTEYFNISNDYLYRANNSEKYIPLKVDATISIFKGKCYIPFENESSFDEIVKKLKSNLTPKNLIIREKYGEQLKQIEALCDARNYSAALGRVDRAINNCGRNRMNKIELYNMKLFITIQLGQTNSAVQVARELISDLTQRIKEKIGYAKMAVIFGNCALAFRMKDVESEEYEQYAKKAYNAAQKSVSDQEGYFASMYSTALYENKIYTNAYELSKKSLDTFEHTFGNPDLYNENVLKTYFERKANVAEIACACYKNIEMRERERHNLQKDMVDNITDIILAPAFNDMRSIHTEVYRIAAFIFTTLHESSNR